MLLRPTSADEDASLEPPNMLLSSVPGPPARLEEHQDPYLHCALYAGFACSQVKGDEFFLLPTVRSGPLVLPPQTQTKAKDASSKPIMTHMYTGLIV